MHILIGGELYYEDKSIGKTTVFRPYEIKEDEAFQHVEILGFLTPTGLFSSWSFEENYYSTSFTKEYYNGLKPNPLENDKKNIIQKYFTDLQVQIFKFLDIELDSADRYYFMNREDEISYPKWIQNGEVYEGYMNKKRFYFSRCKAEKTIVFSRHRKLYHFLKTTRELKAEHFKKGLATQNKSAEPKGLVTPNKPDKQTGLATQIKSAEPTDLATEQKGGGFFQGWGNGLKRFVGMGEGEDVALAGEVKFDEQRVGDSDKEEEEESTDTAPSSDEVEDYESANEDNEEPSRPAPKKPAPSRTAPINDASGIVPKRTAPKLTTADGVIYERKGTRYPDHPLIPGQPEFIKMLKPYPKLNFLILTKKQMRNSDWETDKPTKKQLFDYIEQCAKDKNLNILIRYGDKDVKGILNNRENPAEFDYTIDFNDDGTILQSLKKYDAAEFKS